MLRLTVFAATVGCCSALLPSKPVFSHVKVQHDSSRHGVVARTAPKHAPTAVYMSSSSSASPPPPARETSTTALPEATALFEQRVDRRTLLTETIPASLAVGAMGIASIATAAPGSAFASASRARPKAAPPGTKVVVLGGNGFVGSKVCEALVEAGVNVVSVSRSGAKPTQWADGQSWVEKVSWTKGDPTAGDLSQVFSGAAAVISCVGVIGGSDAELERGNGDVNVAAVSQAAKAKTGRFVYVSVSKLVPDAVGGAVLKGYFDGKKRAEEAIAKSFPTSSVLIKPTFIYGGDSFGLTPPRVSDGYGSGIDALLSSGLVRGIAGISPGLIKVALSPPVSRDSVALACVAGALGRLQGSSFDGADEINAAAKQA